VKRAALAALLTLIPGIVRADIVADTLTYTCDAGEIVFATYLESGESYMVVLALAGQQVALPIDGPFLEAASRFADAPGGSPYVWQMNDLSATLSLRSEADESLLMTCKTRIVL
jgi:membrane-bound inhibitor of C-type lysozyme